MHKQKMSLTQTIKSNKPFGQKYRQIEFSYFLLLAESQTQRKSYLFLHR